MASATHYTPGTTHKKAYTDTSAAIDTAIGAGVYVVRILCTTDAHITFAASPTAVATDMLITANTPEYFSVTEGQKVAAIREALDGDLYVTEMVR
jgi:MinD superfamily P-loop ATPase